MVTRPASPTCGRSRPGSARGAARRHAPRPPRWLRNPPERRKTQPTRGTQVLSRTPTSNASGSIVAVRSSELGHRERPLRDDAAARRAVVAVAAGLPDAHAGDRPAGPRRCSACIASGRTSIQAMPSSASRREVPHDVLDLVLDHREDRAVVGVGPVQHEQVREPGGRDAQVRLRAVVPRVVDAATVATDHVDRRQVLRRREAGREDDRVDLAVDAVLGDDTVRGDARDRLGDELQVGLVERRVVEVREQRPLAAVRVRRAELAPHLGIAHDVDRGETRRLALGAHLRVGERHALVHRSTRSRPEREHRRRVDAERVELLVACTGRRAWAAPSWPCAGTGAPGRPP